MMKSSSSLLATIFLGILASVSATSFAFDPKKLVHSTPELSFPDSDDELSFYYYHKKCPDLEGIIHRKVDELVKKDYTIGAALIRLHFHDCAVRGCDASILLDHQGSEKRANVSRTLRGFEAINEIKAEIEKKCPKVVSCADILTATARDATVKLGGPFWMVPYGRKDGRVSIAREADAVPMGHEKITDLIEFFQSKGLNVLDLVVLSGMHTIGRSSCGAIQYRLYNFQGTGKPDPTINPKYLNYLKRKCRSASENVYLDGVTPRKFDNQYYKNLEWKMGLFSTDQLLYSDSRTRPLVEVMSSQASVFESQVAVSMAKLGNIQDYQNEDDDEVRVHCSFVNPKKH